MQSPVLPIQLAAQIGECCSACTATATHILITLVDDALDVQLAGIKNSKLQVQSCSSSVASQEVCTQLTGSLEDSQPIAHWQDCGVLTNHNKHTREAMLRRADAATSSA